MTILKHFQLNDNLKLEKCHSEITTDNSCIEQIINELEKLNSNTIVLIINYDNNILNAASDRIISMVKESSKSVIINRFPNIYGINVIGNKADILKIFNTKDFDSFSHIDDDGTRFTEVADWKIEEISVEKFFIHCLTFQNRPPPLVLMMKNDPKVLDIRNYFLSRLQQHRPMNPYLDTIPIITVNVVIAKHLLFFEEFFNGLVGQTYPKNKINLQIILENRQNEASVLKLFNPIKNQYKSFKIMPHENPIDARIEVLKSESSSQFMLYIHSSIVLRYTSTFSSLVAQDVDVIGPKIKTNSFRPKTKQQCEVNQATFTHFSVDTPFPPKGTEFWKKPSRILVSMQPNIILLDLKLTNHLSINFSQQGSNYALYETILKTNEFLDPYATWKNIHVESRVQ